MFDLENKIAIVTGSSRGIGKEIAICLAKHGVTVFLNGKDENRLLQARDEISSQGLSVDFFLGDVSDEKVAKNFVETVHRKTGKLDILINNAGVGEWRTLEKISNVDWERVINNNLKSAFLMSREAVNFMKRRKNGKIINIASASGIRGRSGGAHYVASKSGLIGLTKALAIELGPFGITVNAVAPGLTPTDMSRETYGGDMFEGVRQNTPLKRLGYAEDIANAVLFLSSGFSDFITGEVIIVDGGNHLR